MAVFDVENIVRDLDAIRSAWRDSQQRRRAPEEREFPSREALENIANQFKRALFPMRLGPRDMRHESENFYVGYTLDTALHELLAQARLELRYVARHGERDDFLLDRQALDLVRLFAARLPEIRRTLDSDVLAAYQGDPAARSVDEVLLCYPGVHALIHHRLAHQLYSLGLPLLARILAEISHGETGIDIHPGIPSSRTASSSMPERRSWVASRWARTPSSAAMSGSPRTSPRARPSRKPAR